MTTHEVLFIPKANECEPTFTHYDDQPPTREDLMGKSAAQSLLIFYLINVLQWLYRAEDWFVVSNLNIHRKRNIASIRWRRM